MGESGLVAEILLDYFFEQEILTTHWRGFKANEPDIQMRALPTSH